ncbi:hypothetical protein EVA_14538 [gut metagenome]|uniref:Uncharacterized protein n=1 Tax=gut metagenome TaxID=749906 RepID=J9FQW8_9ZZZZ
MSIKKNAPPNKGQRIIKELKYLSPKPKIEKTTDPE